MNKTDLIEHVSVAAKLNKKESAAATEAVVDAITEALINGEEVRVPTFGTFKVKSKAERQGYNPQNGEKITIPAYKTVHFQVSKDLKNRLN